MLFDDTKHKAFYETKIQQKQSNRLSIVKYQKDY